MPSSLMSKSNSFELCFFFSAGDIEQDLHFSSFLESLWLTHNTFIQVSLFPDRPPTNPEFHYVGASGVAKFAVFGGHHVSTSAGAGGLLCALRVRTRVNARLHARPKFPRARLRVVLALLHPPKSHQIELPIARLRPQRSCDHFCSIPIKNRHTGA